MKYLLLVFIFMGQGMICQGAQAKDWYVGVWEFDPGLTQRNNPGMTNEGIRSAKAEFDKWAGQVGVTPRRIKGNKAKLGVPYRVVRKERQTVSFQVRGAVVGIVKSFRPDLRKMDLTCKIVQINSNVMAFEVPELRTIRMYLRRVR